MNLLVKGQWDEAGSGVMLGSPSTKYLYVSWGLTMEQVTS